MAFVDRVLADDERLVIHQHPHWKQLLVPACLVPLVVGVCTFGILAMPPGHLQAPGRGAIAGIGLVLLVAFSLLPWLRWRTTHFLVTDQRVIVRSGVLSRTGRDIPLSRVNDVTFTHHLVERVLRCGTLTIESGGERGQLVLTDVPQVELVQRVLAELVERTLAAEHRAPGPQRAPDPERRALEHE